MSILDNFDLQRTIGTINNPYRNKNGSVEIGFDHFPYLIPIVLKTRDIDGLLGQIRGASARRRFYLESDWKVSIKIDKNKYQYFKNKDLLDEYVKLNGIIIIPKNVDNSKTKFDGASIPFPWLVSFLSFGILRPLGVMLTASIVHDFIYEYGYLYRCNNGSMEPIEVQRELADKLFYDMIDTVNDMPFTACIGWLAVRIGWFCVGFKEKEGEEKRPRGGNPPWTAIIVLSFLLFLLIALIVVFGVKTFVFVVSMLYAFIFVLIQLTAHLSNKESSDTK